MPQNYSDKLKDHYRHPRDTGKLDEFTHTAETINPLCGDETKVYLKVENGTIKDISHETRGCMICVAAASVVSEYARGKKITDIKKIGAHEVANFLDVSISPAREQCAMLIIKSFTSF